MKNINTKPRILVLEWEGKRHEFDMTKDRESKLFTKISRIISVGIKRI